MPLSDRCLFSCYGLGFDSCVRNRIDDTRSFVKSAGLPGEGVLNPNNCSEIRPASRGVPWELWPMDGEDKTRNVVCEEATPPGPGRNRRGNKLLERVDCGTLHGPLCTEGDCLCESESGPMIEPCGARPPKLESYGVEDRGCKSGQYDGISENPPHGSASF